MGKDNITLQESTMSKSYKPIKKNQKSKIHVQECKCAFCCITGKNKLYISRAQDQEVSPLESALFTGEEQTRPQTSNIVQSNQTIFKVIQAGLMNYLCLAKPNGQPVKILTSYVEKKDELKKRNNQLLLTDFIGFKYQGKSSAVWQVKCTRCKRILRSPNSMKNGIGKTCYHKN